MVEIVRPKLYRLKEGDFSPENVPENPANYHFPEPVNRENFNAFLMDSFAQSKGDLWSHKKYFRVLEAASGFDSDASIRNFLRAGGWEVLSQAERDEFELRFRRVGGHLGKADVDFDPESDGFNVKEELHSVLTEVIYLGLY